jgi:hypothetical protein
MVDVAERRRLERFDLKTPTKLTFEKEKGKREIVSLVTRDISSQGAFLVTQEPLDKGMAVKLELHLSLETLQRMLNGGGTAKVQVRGTVIRKDDGGMAVQFDNRFKIMGENDAGV